MLFWVVSALFALLAFFLFLEVLLASFAATRLSSHTVFTPKVALDARAVIVVPAHNEEKVIGDTLASILPQLRDRDELVVVADNCSDNTKALAEKFGATVIVRNDAHKRGKGYALDFAVNHIKERGFDAILMIDADCIVEPGCRDQLVEEALVAGRPVQCLYLMRSDKDSPTLSQKVSEFAWLIKNKLRPLGLLKLKGPCHLMGTGMAFPAKMLYEANLANGCIVEDMKLGLDLAIAGTSPKFLPDAVVWSRFPDSEEVSEGQKSRWIHGHLEMISLYVPQLLKNFILKRDFNLLLLCFELLVPPLVFMLLINVALLFVTLLVSLFAGVSLYILPMLSVCLMGLTIVIAWLLGGRNIISIDELLKGLISRLKSSSVYLKFFTGRRKDWNKTSRK
jgi:cellulose synthase/poly-beta-1,6-N-acetylglucosamine synthase-like glycosyltransferase